MLRELRKADQTTEEKLNELREAGQKTEGKLREADQTSSLVVEQVKDTVTLCEGYINSLIFYHLNELLHR